MTAQSERLRGGKREAIIALFSVAVLIAASGLFFGVYCLIHNISYPVMGFSLPGALFGLVAAFLGVRYCVATVRFSKKLAGNNQLFNWSNFKIDRTNKKGRRK